MYIRVDYENATLERVLKAAETPKDPSKATPTFHPQAGCRHNNWVAFEVHGKRLKFDKIKDMIRDLVWGVNNGAYCEVTEITGDQLEDLMY